MAHAFVNGREVYDVEEFYNTGDPDTKEYRFKYLDTNEYGFSTGNGIYLVLDEQEERGRLWINFKKLFIRWIIPWTRKNVGTL